MELWAQIALITAIAAVVLFGLWMWTRNRRSQELRQRFGPEYERAVEKHGGGALPRRT